MPEFHVIIQLNDKYGINVAAVALEEFLMVEKVLASDIFFNIIYIMIAKLLAAVSTMVWILDSGTTRHVSGDRAKFPDMVDYKHYNCAKKINPIEDLKCKD